VWQKATGDSLPAGKWDQHEISVAFSSNLFVSDYAQEIQP
jgi:hypothetical protein